MLVPPQPLKGVPITNQNSKNSLKRGCSPLVNTGSFDFAIDRVAVDNFAQDDSFGVGGIQNA